MKKLRNVGFNYKLDPEQRLLFKEEKEANMNWENGGVPAINKAIADKLKGTIKRIGVKTQKRKFLIPAKAFYDNAKVIQYEGFEPQYIVDWHFFGTVEELPQQALL